MKVGTSSGKIFGFFHSPALPPQSSYTPVNKKLRGLITRIMRKNAIFFAAAVARHPFASSTRIATVTPGIYTLKDGLVQKISKFRYFRWRPDDRRRHHSHRTPGIYAMKKRFGPPFSGKIRNFSGHPLPRPTSHIGYISEKRGSGNAFVEKIPTFFRSNPK